MISHSFIDGDGGVFLCVSEVRQVPRNELPAPWSLRKISGVGVEKPTKMGFGVDVVIGD